LHARFLVIDGGAFSSSLICLPTSPPPPFLPPSLSPPLPSRSPVGQDTYGAQHLAEIAYMAGPDLRQCCVPLCHLFNPGEFRLRGGGGRHLGFFPLPSLPLLASPPHTHPLSLFLPPHTRLIKQYRYKLLPRWCVPPPRLQFVQYEGGKRVDLYRPLTVWDKGWILVLNPGDSHFHLGLEIRAQEAAGGGGRGGKEGERRAWGRARTGRGARGTQPAAAAAAAPAATTPPSPV
jgi:hypothetical protein